ncbi:MAG: Septum site-determining protein MinD [Planctomycetes bacterium ADurb.Bin412]|nr:MAG: Septum site-determining protein MinD [Planctomycetes bacterium ADurb.Bin412]
MTDETCKSGCSQDSCSSGSCGHGEVEENLDEFLENQMLADRLDKIDHKILVMSGKGGVGKSTVAVNLAVTLSLSGYSVGLLDVDIHGPSIPRLLKLDGKKVEIRAGQILPLAASENLKVMSIGFLLQNRDDALIWRGPMKMGIIKQFLKDVEWGKLDYLVIDSPPGTGDEPLSICQLIPNLTGAVIVTSPQELSLSDVRKSITFCRQLKLPMLGVVENMSGFACPHCGKVTDIFSTGGGEKMASQMSVPFLGRVPIDPRVCLAGDAGEPYVYHYAKTEAAQALEKIAEPILKATQTPKEPSPVSRAERTKTMRIAVPVTGGRLAMHFGHCDQFAIFDVDPTTEKILNQDLVAAPAHEPGLLPRWLGEKGVQQIICGGMGARAQELFSQRQIAVITGASGEEPEAVIRAYLDGSLATGENVCDH